jgi:UDP-N-acetylmuramate: L-alanyl-gamma-D-glutamyl-meso-diaminopimelate ligase
VFEPRSNTMKLGTMKAQLPWSLEQADLAFCHSGGLGWDAADAMAPMGSRAQVADTIDGGWRRWWRPPAPATMCCA